MRNTSARTARTCRRYESGVGERRKPTRASSAAEARVAAYALTETERAEATLYMLLSINSKRPATPLIWRTVYAKSAVVVTRLVSVSGFRLTTKGRPQRS